jgi:hypothetical protein
MLTIAPQLLPSYESASPLLSTITQEELDAHETEPPPPPGSTEARADHSSPDADADAASNAAHHAHPHTANNTHKTLPRATKRPYSLSDR